MINSFQSINTITSGLILQQLEQEINASNIANPSVDSNGYLMNSLEQVNVGSNAPLTFDSGNSLLQVGTGPVGTSITRLRSSFLDTQIQQESSVVGKAEILNQTIQQVNGILNPSSGTLNSALNAFATDWTNLAPNPTSASLATTVVSDGVAYATLANNQYMQLQGLQNNLNAQVQQTVTEINQLSQQLSSINKQLLATQGSDQDSLLDARDYALDRLSRLINIQTSFGSLGTAQVNIAGSSLSLVDGAGAAILQTNVLNPHNPGLSDVSFQSSEGSLLSPDISQWVTGGNLAGELQARDVVVQGYKDQLNQAVFSVITNTNMLYQAGYAGTTTNTTFFTGSSAQDINVNGALVNTPTSLATASRTAGATDLTTVVGSVLVGGVPTPVTNQGQIAMFLGNLPNLLAINYMQSRTNINKNGVGPGSGFTYVDPTQPFNSGVTTALNVNGSNLANFTNALGPAGSFTINGNLITYTNSGDSINSILDKINAADPNVEAVFNYSQQTFYILSDNPVNLASVGGNFKNTSLLNNLLTSSFVLNNGFAYTDPPLDPTLPLNAPINTQAFRVTPGTSGTVVVNGVPIQWNDTQSLLTILASLPVPAGLNQSGAGGNVPNPPFPPRYSYTISLYGNSPITIDDQTGNFTAFTGLNTPDATVGQYSSNILTQLSSDSSNAQVVYNQANSSLTQLNNAQANIAGVSTASGQAGVPIATIEQQAMQSLIAYNAMLEVLQVIDNMYVDLIDMVGGSTTPIEFSKATASA